MTGRSTETLKVATLKTGLLNCAGALAIFASCVSLPAHAQANEPTIEFDMPAQDLSKALKSYGVAADRQVMFAANIVRDKQAKKISGDLTPTAALDELLDGTGLVYETTSSNVIIVKDPLHEASLEQEARREGIFRVAQVTQEDVVREVGGARDTGDEEERQDTIVVTGTLIRNANEGASPVLQFDRDEILNGGFATTQQFVQSLPQNFGLGANEGTVFGTEATQNFGFGSSINLRGLGSDSTLVLINGRRLAAAGGFAGDFTDISTIPLTAIERVEVLTDGASAVYGTDAIAGVINFILRDDYEGAETRLRYGTVTKGGLNEFQVGQSLGKSWSSGSVLLSYEYYDRDRLGSEDRNFTANSDLTPFGGESFSDPFGSPANILDPATGFRTVAFAVPTDQDGTMLTPSDLLPGTANLRNLREDVDTLPDTKRHNVFLTARQELTPQLEIFGEFQFGQREFESRIGGQIRSRLTVPDENPFFVDPFGGATSIRVSYNFANDLGPRLRFGDVQNYRGVLGSRFDITDTWQVELYGAYNNEKTETNVFNGVSTPRLDEAVGLNVNSSVDLIPGFDPLVDGFFNPFADGSNTPQNVLDFIRGSTVTNFEGELWTAHIKADGELIDLPGGAIQLAVGAEYREESFKRQTVSDATTASLEVIDPNTSSGQRDVISFFGELFVPLISDDNALSGFRRLDVSASVRYEDYSDFGASTNPKVGVVWAPVDGLVFRSTWGTSFKAPKITDVDPKGQVFFEFPFVPDPLAPPPGFSSAVFLSGSNPGLTAEESTAWTIGTQINPSVLEGFSFDITYFNIEFDNRIETPSNPFGFLFDPDNFGAFFERDPDDAVVQGFFDSPFFFGTPFLPASDIDVILDGRASNFARTEVRGLDFAMTYGFDTYIGAFDLGLNANYLLAFENAFAPGADLTDFVDTVNNPVDLRLRAAAGWSHEGWGANIFVNYTDGYSDTLSSPERVVDSWTTFDLQLQYNTASKFGSRWIDGTIFSINIQNLFDEDPPFVNNPAGLAYDPNNATALGRFLSFQITKAW